MMTRSKTRAAAAPCDKCHKITHYDDFRWYEKDDIGVCPECEYELYDCLENNPRCPCGLLLSMDDMAVWEEDESKTPMCEACLDDMENDNDDDDDNDEDEEEDDAAFCQFCDEDDKYKIAGCCDNCPHNVENMCLDCGTWYDNEGVWRCPDCADNADSGAEAADLDLKIAQARWDDLDNYTMMGMTVPNSEAWADLRLERQALNCYLKTTGKPWPKIRDPAACIAWCRAP